MVEGPPARRPDRREPERPGQDDRVGLLGAPEPRAPVSTPLAWDEVGDGLDPASFDMASVLQRVQTLGDLHAGLRTTRQSLSRALSQLA